MIVKKRCCNMHIKCLLFLHGTQMYHIRIIWKETDCMRECLWQCKASFQRKIQLIGVIADSSVLCEYKLHQSPYCLSMCYMYWEISKIWFSHFICFKAVYWMFLLTCKSWGACLKSQENFSLSNQFSVAQLLWQDWQYFLLYFPCCALACCVCFVPFWFERAFVLE